MYIKTRRNNVLDLLDIELSTKTYYLIAFSLSLAYTLHLFPLKFISGKSGFWFNTDTDPTQHITGMWAFIHDQWRFPLLFTKLLNYPEGVSASFTDSIPIAAIPFKLIHGLLPEGSHYFGVWVLACYVGQGITGAYCMTVSGRHTVIGAVAGALFVVMMPALMIRIPHAALLAQFTLLLALAWYFKLSTGNLSLAAYVKFGTILLLIASAIHPYLIAMLYPMYVVTVLGQWIKARLPAAPSIAKLLLPLPFLALSFYCLGYLTFDKGLPPLEGGFINSSMNLISPLLGTQLAPSYFIPSKGLVLDATGGQIDGHNYLGVPLMLMLAYIVLRQRGKVIVFLNEHWLLSLLMLGFGIYSLSNNIYLLDKLVLQYPVPGPIVPITKIFRASGRFFWPIGYALILIAVTYFLSRRDKIHNLAIVLLLVVQYVDTVHHREYLAEAAGRSPHFKYAPADWDFLIKKANAVYLLPTYGCGGDPTTALFIQYFASLHGIPFNTGFVARVSANCAEKNAALARDFNNGNLFVLPKNHTPSGDLEKTIGPHYREWCREHAVGTVCQIGGNADSWQHVNGKMFTPVTQLAPATTAQQ